MTMHQELLELLKTQWVTPVDALQKAHCFSLSQRCGEFRRAGVNVLDKWVKTDSGKKVKAYKVVA